MSAILSASRRGRRLLPAAVAIALGACALAPAAACADFGQATLLSGTSAPQFEQPIEFNEANAPALAAGGRYVVFQGRLAGVPGVWRRDLLTGEVALVAGAFALLPGASEAQRALNAPDAAAPSISADGRTVAFTTSADLEPLEDGRGEPPSDRGCPEVYVRDMSVQAGRPGAYTLAAALDGSGEGIAFTQRYAACRASSGFPPAGAQAAAGVALSEDGRRVAFTVLSESNLGGAATSPGQVAVRDLETQTTTLVTSTPAGAPVMGGGAFPDAFALANGAQLGSIGLENGQTQLGDQAAGSTAAISADGSTVAWLGMNVPAQVPGAAGIEKQIEEHARGGGAGGEAEPLWRRLGGGATVRLLAGSDLGFFVANPAERPNPVEDGSLIGTQDADYLPPALSRDGDTVAVVASAPGPAAVASVSERVSGLSAFNSDAFAVRVDGPAGAPQVRPLTELTTYDAPREAVEAVKDVAISPDGTRVAFDTARSPLYLPSLVAISPPAAEEHSTTYEANLELNTLQRVTATYDGAEANGQAGLLSFSGDGHTLAFASQATNLIFGDAIDAWQVYAARELPESAQPTPQEIGAQPSQPSSPGPTWLLNVTAVPERDGSALVRAGVPGAGRLTVSAGAQLPGGAARGARPPRHGGPRGRRAAAA
ncbi:MAG: hypothetical protein FWD42_09630, partial [Solirubrobacterales bacterium]|nr:hypothetical protein [Solirubrobacterales bacterium]